MLSSAKLNGSGFTFHGFDLCIRTEGEYMKEKEQHHIAAQRVIDFANDRIEFTDDEVAHFDQCDRCNIALREMLRVSARVRSILQSRRQNRGQFSRAA